MNTNFFKYLGIMIFGISILAAKEEISTAYTFLDLETHVQNGQLIEIRGFLYETEQKQLILAAEPNLKSCCVGSHSKRQKQLLVSGDVKEGISSMSAVTLKGELLVHFGDIFPFRLENASIQVQPDIPYSMLGVLTMILVFTGIWLILRAKK